MWSFIKVRCLLLPLILLVLFAFPASYAYEEDDKLNEGIIECLQIDSNDVIISSAVSDDLSFAALIVRHETDLDLSFYIIEKDDNGWTISDCNEQGMLREYDPFSLPHLSIGPNGLEDQQQNEIYIQYESADLAGWDESLTIKKSLTGWSFSEYSFCLLGTHQHYPFYLYLVDDPIDPRFNCLAQYSFCLVNCYIDPLISSISRDQIRDGIIAMFDYDAIEAWVSRNPDIENYKNYYDWVMNH